MQNSNVEDTKFPANKFIRVHDKLIDLSTPIIMGIVNTTPDSFYSASRVTKAKDILFKVEKMVIEGATIVDIGGYSSRPGAENVTVQEELNRVIPNIEAIRNEFPEILLSLDTFRSEVASSGADAGIDIINDISGFAIDPKIIQVAAKHNLPYILMHMRGTPRTMQTMTDYDNIFQELAYYFSSKISLLKDTGVTDIIIDPGFGFSKTTEQNHFLLEHLNHFQFLEKPIMVGISRKSMVYKTLKISPEEALEGTTELHAIALKKGVSILRVHDVREAVELIRSFEQINS